MGYIGYWAEVTAKEFAALDRNNAVAVLPIGAIEQHGPHLAMSVDRDLTDAVVARMLPLLPRELTVLVLPVQAIGKSNEHDRWPGTLSLSMSTLLAVLRDVAQCVRRADVPKLLFVNGHGGNKAVLEIAVRDLRAEFGLTTAHVAWDDLAEAAEFVGEAEARDGLHAGDVETSAMLAAWPDRVRKDQTAIFGSAHLGWRNRHPDLGLGPVRLGWQMHDLNRLGAIGNASAATAAKGHQLLDTAAHNLARAIGEFATFTHAITE